VSRRKVARRTKGRALGGGSPSVPGLRSVGLKPIGAGNTVKSVQSESEAGKGKAQVGNMKKRGRESVTMREGEFVTAIREILSGSLYHMHIGTQLVGRKSAETSRRRVISEPRGRGDG